MAKQYWVGDFLIDISRNQITQYKRSQTLAPKALAVLTCLAENQGKVVSQQILLENVWRDTVVSPNTLQRSIAQLRKALGDDGKVQTYIKTHAKQGYSLECDVRWQEKIESPRQSNTPKNTVDKNGPVKEFSNSNALNDVSKTPIWRWGSMQLSIFTGIIILGILGYTYLVPQQTSQLTVKKIHSLTATDDKEFDATYTPDGKYIVFHRYLDKLCMNKLWAKNIRTQQETLLTKNWGTYGKHSFSTDGKKLVFLATEACTAPVRQKNCYDLVSLDFEKALENPQQAKVLLQCENSQIKNPIWLNNNNIALLQKQTNRWKIISYSIRNNTSTDIYSPKDRNLVDFDYSVGDKLIAVVSVYKDNRQYLDLLKPDGRVLSSRKIKGTKEIPRYRTIYPEFDPLNKQLIFSTGRHLYTLSYEGKVASISLPFTERMVLPEFHPGGKKLLMIKGPYDSDIVLLSRDKISEKKLLVQTNEAPPRKIKNYKSFERSTLGEGHAIFQPGGELIVFWSERSGAKQLWVSDGDSSQQLTQFPLDTRIRGIAWAADGKSILVNVNSVLTQVFLNSSQKSFPLSHPVIQLFQWDSNNDSALLRARIKGISKTLEYDLSTSKYREISEKKILWALKSADGRLIYKDHLGQFWQPGPVEPSLIKALEKQKSKTKKFIIKENIIYAINTDNQLWSYDLDSEVFNILGELSEDVDQLTDINQTHLLMTLKISAKKEVVELSLSD